jgi:multidrug efflux pump subunit AcrA (membrane-fusion protein)
MKMPLFLRLSAVLILGFSAVRANPVILDATGTANLRLEIAPADETTFEETLFALGRIALLPGHRAVVSSRIPGRATEVFLKEDHPVKAGDPAVIVESRQAGNPPPRVEIAAPIGGMVRSVGVVPGQPVEPSDVLAEIIDLSTVYARAAVPEDFAQKLRVGQTARIRVPAVGGDGFSATLEHIGSTADPATGTLEAAFRLPNPDGKLRPGMRAEFSIVVERRDNVLAVPREAVQGDAANRFVFVKHFELPNAFVKAPVVVGAMNDQRAEILSGLFPADEVVTRGAYALSHAGGGSISLKEALDAAHGHEHAADGSELPQQPTPASPGTATGSGGLFWKILSGVLFLALVLVTFLRPRRHA